MEKDNILLSWFAAFYEGEGWVCNDKGNSDRLKVGIAQNDPAPLELGRNIWGGTIRERIRKSPASNKICNCHEWDIGEKNGLQFLNDIIPFMKIPYKQKQLQACLDKRMCGAGIKSSAEIFSGNTLSYTFDHGDKRPLLSWFAGFYEGEGWIVNEKQNRNRLRVGIAQNDPSPLKLGQEIWGGTIHERIRKSPASDKICKGHEWRLNHNDGSKFISDIKPFMRIPFKTNQIKKCILKANIPWKGIYTCSQCEKTYKDGNSLRRHKLMMHIEKEKMYSCLHNGCRRRYKYKDSLKRHIKLNH